MDIPFKKISRSVFADKPLLTALIALGLSSIFFCIFVAFSLHPNEVQVVTHYSMFGSTFLYRDKWYYLISFLVFGLLHGGIYGALTCKIFVQKGRELAIPFAWLGVVIIIIASCITYQLLKIAAI